MSPISSRKRSRIVGKSSTMKMPVRDVVPMGCIIRNPCHAPYRRRLIGGVGPIRIEGSGAPDAA
jgi:hypothetical protein